MHPETFFSEDYFAARAAFLAAASAVGARVESLENGEASGPAGEALFADVARIGATGADGVAIVTSATHGAEGFCGSGCAVGFLRSGLYREVPEGVALVLVHAINPYGFAHLRRVTEGNVDLNRNVRDHAAPHPPNPAYAEVHPLLVPADWDGPARAAADRAIEAYIAERGEMAFQTAVSGGQYDFPDGLFYGGRAPTWSNRAWRRIIRDHAAGCRRIAHLDFHTGLGPYGECELIAAKGSGPSGLRRARDWFGNGVTSPSEGGSASAPVQGVISEAFSNEAPGAKLTAVTLEFGTRPVLEVLNALRADNWLHVHGDPASKQAGTIARQMRHTFYGDEPAWKDQVFGQAAEVLRQTFRGLAQK